MTIRELKELLEAFDEDKDVIVFDEEAGTLKDAVSVSSNNGHIQINIL